MQGSSPHDYFEHRAEQERVAAEQAIDERAAHAHRALAAWYRKLASGSIGAAQRDGQTDGGTLPKDFWIVP